MCCVNSDPLDARLARHQIVLIDPHRRGRRVPNRDGRTMRRHRLRWKVQRSFAWLQQFRRLVTATSDGQEVSSASSSSDESSFCFAIYEIRSSLHPDPATLGDCMT